MKNKMVALTIISMMLLQIFSPAIVYAQEEFEKNIESVTVGEEKNESSDTGTSNSSIAK
ncbi:hypothetical protein QWY90_01555 [Flavobacterium paronense]|nr:hypothetical protein [Flavobacterium paronense]MDN3675994.1 hypothetical protein [Flavobacterium paronense]